MSLQESAAQAVLPIDPDLVDAPAHRRRFADDDVFVAAIREDGQIAPIVVRPHPNSVGRFELVCGLRRLEAARALGRPVQAIVRDLSDAEAARIEGQENVARRNLTFIEQAEFARGLEGRGISRADIMAALQVDKFGLAARLHIAFGIPSCLSDVIGPAPASGLNRWRKLAERLREPGALKRAQAAVETPQFQRLASDARLGRLSSLLGAREKR